MFRSRGLLRAAVTATAWVVLFNTPTLAQDPTAVADAGVRVAASVDYVSVDGFYLDVGSDSGAVRGDTVAVYASADAADPFGVVVLVSVTRRRSVARALGDLELDRGDVLFLPLAPPEAVVESGAPTPRPQPSRSTSAPSIRGGPRVTGRLSIDLDARETRTSWGGDLFGSARRRFLAPTTRLSLSVTRLPGGFRFRTSLRAAYRYDDIAVGPPPLSVRAYEAAVSREFDVVPVQITLGRFSNPFESYSAYWDGALLRIGGSAGGVGVVAGFEPDRYDEGVSTDLARLTGFADLDLRGRSWRYSTDVSAHLLRPVEGTDRGYVGWTQRASLGPLTLSQRLRLDGGIDGTRFVLGQARVRAVWRLTRRLGVRATYGRSRGPFAGGTGLFDAGLPDAPSREEITAGADLRGPLASVSFDGGRSRREGEPEAGMSLGGSVGLSLGGSRVTVSGRRWSNGDTHATSVAPRLTARLASVDWRTGYRYYQTDTAGTATSIQAVELQAGVLLFNDLHLTLRGEEQWGSQLSGTRVHVGLWRPL